MALHLTTMDGEPLTLTLSDLFAIRHADEGTLVLLHSGETVPVRESDEEIHALIRIEYGRDAAPFP